MRSRRVLAAALAAACLAAIAGCGSGSSPTAPGPSASTAYTQALQRVAARENIAQHRVADGFRSKTVAKLRQALRSFEADQTAAATLIASLEPPPNAVKANAALAQAFVDSADAIDSLIRRIAHAKTVKHAFFIIQSDAAGPRVGKEIDAALNRLNALGYTTGS